MSDLSKPVLAFDTAFGGCVICVFHPLTGKSVTRVLPTDREQAAKLVPLIQSAMEESGTAFADLGLVVTTCGPGSFTGLRISLSTARSFGLSLNIPVQGVGSFEVMARSCIPDETDKNSLVVLESKRSDFYVQHFDRDFKAVGEAFCAQSSQLQQGLYKNAILCGDASTRLEAELGREFIESFFADVVRRSLPDPDTLAKIGLNVFAQNGGRADKPVPVYLRDADVSISNKQNREINHIPV